MRDPHAPRFVDLRPLAALAASSLLMVGSALQAAPPAEPLAGTGTIKGKLIWDAGPVPARKIAVAKGDPKVKDAVCKANDIVDKDIVVDPETKGVVNAFAYLVKPSGKYEAAEKALLEASPEVVIDQVGCEFIPYAAIVHKDQKLVFKSSDPVGHNVRFNAFANGAVNQMLAPNGKMTFPIKKEERRPTQLACDIHPWMKGYFFVLEHPFAAVTQADGSFEITGVPAGVQHLVVWQSTKGYVSEGGNKGMSVTVPADGVVDVGAIKISK
ncbi:carboxypeptidase regulatory-like domain-containing protein [Tundrisphaera lichenicola]|uniref:carboxypeptidase regulatory-like domain-containing protein n=1 Tax=Tundrisphaera lichenicola TaxID=2029860 RepID=UPI003EB8215D